MGFGRVDRAAQLDFSTAEQAYRRILAIVPRSADAMNNLAYLLWLKGDDKDLPEAQKLSESAIAARPGDATFYDTLARIQAKFGAFAAARESFATAIAKDPNSIEAMIGLADLLSRDPASRDAARDLLIRVHKLMQANPLLSPVLQKQYQAAKNAVAEIP